MHIYQRSIHSNIHRVDSDHLQVNSTLLDLEHSFHLQITVCESSGEVEAAKVTMSKSPFQRCQQGADGISKLVGMRVGRGVIKELHRRIGGPRGCAHLEELVADAVRLVAMLRLGDSAGYWRDADNGDSEEERIAAGKPVLRNTCIVYADDPS